MPRWPRSRAMRPGGGGAWGAVVRRSFGCRGCRGGRRVAPVPVPGGRSGCGRGRHRRRFPRSTPGPSTPGVDGADRHTLGLGVAVLAALAVPGTSSEGLLGGRAAEVATVPYVITMTEGRRGQRSCPGLVPVVTTLPDGGRPGDGSSSGTRPGCKVQSGRVGADHRVGRAESGRRAGRARSDGGVGNPDPGAEQSRRHEGDRGRRSVAGTRSRCRDRPPSGQTVETGSSVILRVASGKVAVPDLYLMWTGRGRVGLLGSALTMQVAGMSSTTRWRRTRCSRRIRPRSARRGWLGRQDHGGQGVTGDDDRDHPPSTTTTTPSSSHHHDDP